ncbi:ABC transporter ATP-binding protein [Saccharomonospora viridis]|uniref:Multidrug ABC transporter ATPase n=1 Tax=Saccharomonospora viridis TaxID=1852 RepID=A0A837DA10_9PSEU|nr:ABC transporter ATP-binding protein [Saccharomonospora viridis]KHF44663.1 multidrug ABC transporter ATPase [Saccharomonospora viridis]SFP23352.1 ABC-2 type transport system ATP-binding protein [Saccharomonospora viridis]
MTVASLRGVAKRYGSHAAVSDVSFELHANRIHGLLGRNGAGKSTVMRLLTGQDLPTEGDIEVFGGSPYENADVLRRICFIKESQKYPDVFKARHALKAASLLFPNWDDDFAAELVEEFKLPLNRQVRKLSRGQLSIVGVIIGLAARAPLTLFDEPYLGLDAVARQLFYDRLLADYAEHPRTIVLSTHLIDEVSDLIEHVIVIDSGRILMDDSAENLRSQAITVTGPKQAVEDFAAGYTELHREELGGFLRVTLSGAAPRRDVPNLRVEPVSLQQLVVRTTQLSEAERALVGASNGTNGEEAR